MFLVLLCKLYKIELNLEKYAEVNSSDKFESY